MTENRFKRTFKAWLILTGSADRFTKDHVFLEMFNEYVEAGGNEYLCIYASMAGIPFERLIDYLKNGQENINT